MSLQREQPSQPNVLFWGVLAAASVLAVIASLFLRGGLHGLYSDDYVMKAWAFDFSKAGWKLNLNPIDPTFRPLHSLLTPNLANALPHYEWPLRIAIAGVHAANVLLLAVLAHRLTGSLFIALLAGGHFLAPILANEGLLWFTNAVPHTLALLLLLTGFHLVLNCRSVRSGLFPLMGAIAAWSVMVLFVESGLFTLLLLPVFVAMRRDRGDPVSRTAWMATLVASYAFLGFYLLFVLQRSTQIALRGGPVFDPYFILTHRVLDLSRQLAWLPTEWGVSGPLRDATTLGLREWLAVPGGWIILAGLILGLCLVPMMFPTRQENAPSGRHALTLGLAGLAWMGLALLPLLLLKTQPVTSRALYAPSAGLALALAGFLGLIVGSFDRWRSLGMRAGLLVTGGMLCLSALAMAGVVRTYQLRWELDQKQLAALRTAIPRLPEIGPIWLLPVALEERSVSPSLGRGTTLDQYLHGVFERPWSATAALELEYGRADISTVTAPTLDGLQGTAVHRSKRGEGTSIMIQGRVIDVGRLLAFTYRQRHVILLNPLEVVAASGGAVSRVGLPLVAAVERGAGKPESAPLRIEKLEQARAKISVVLFNRHLIYILSLDRLAAGVLPKTGDRISRTELARPLVQALPEAEIDVMTPARDADLRAILVDRLGR